MKSIRDYVKPTETREQMLKLLGTVAVADDEASAEPLIDLFNPAPTREAMSEKFSDTLGYDPITHYDMQDVLDAIRSVRSQLSIGSAALIDDYGDQIADRAMKIYEEQRPNHIKEAVSLALAEYLHNNDDITAASFYLTDMPPKVTTSDDEDAGDEEDSLVQLGDDGEEDEDDPFLSQLNEDEPYFPEDDED